MKAFRLTRPSTAEQAAKALAANGGAALKASGIDLLDRMKGRIDEPADVVGLVDVADLDAIRLEEDGSIRIGATVTLADLAASDAIRQFVPTLAEAASKAASAQLRNRATVGGNLGQHTRCGYYRHREFPCLKRGGDHCPVRKDGGVQDTAGIFANDPCASAHPSSLAPVFGALDAMVLIRVPTGAKAIPFAELWAPPSKGRGTDLALGANDVIEAVEIPARAEPQRLGYAEIRQKAAFDWALVSCAVRLVADGGKVKEARVWFNSVAPTPHRSEAAEKVLVNETFDPARAKKAAEAAVQAATPLPGTKYKVQLAKVALERALTQAWGRKS